MSDYVLHVSDANFDAMVLLSDQPVLVDFWAKWCGPCKIISTLLDDLAQSYEGRLKIVKVDIDENRALAIKYHCVLSSCCYCSKMVKFKLLQIGAVGKGRLTQMIDKVLANTDS